MTDVSIRFTAHAAQQAERRQLDLDWVLEVVRSPDRIVPGRQGREIRQALSEDKRYLIRVVVDVTDRELIIVTMYRTSKIDKYRHP